MLRIGYGEIRGLSQKSVSRHAAAPLLRMVAAVWQQRPDRSSALRVRRRFSSATSSGAGSEVDIFG
jgi:hypothetical protein